MKICLDYGHTLNGVDSGAIGCGYREQDCTREIGKIVKSYLEQLGHTTYETNIDGNVTSISDSMYKRYSIANDNNVDLCVSLHLNAGGGTGSEIYTYNSADVQNASVILNKLSDLGLRNRGIKNGNKLAMVSRPKAKAMLIEICFIDTDVDMKLYAANKNEIAKIIAEGLTGQTLSNDCKKYIVTNYLPNAYAGYNGVDINYVLKYFNGVKTYVRGNNSGVWIETEYLTESKCQELKQTLGSWFYSINQ
ncbi:N-acetylmuramoyl-L-alanine amidase [Clostridium botulinum]|nr:N-acetylmuramoyl-L-alanine amidase [Clostridium botulinum]NFN14839.1 N-acetylmuramoyl-L-alanine amidase [Clostridium botulinum]NFN22708.1 N-acetylmuramoyl-L-alanine amidase [Clostridium botulinum]NFN43382.1 N-acetylmuramoyl-L-alanine amidase [Clostridium botulinum]